MSNLSVLGFKQLKVITAPSAKGKFDCGSNRYCKEVSSCEEARYYLEHCGLTRLDGDNDGIPCESLCQ